MVDIKMSHQAGWGVGGGGCAAPPGLFGLAAHLSLQQGGYDL